MMPSRKAPRPTVSWRPGVWAAMAEGTKVVPTTRAAMGNRGIRCSSRGMSSCLQIGEASTLGQGIGGKRVDLWRAVVEVDMVARPEFDANSRDHPMLVDPADFPAAAKRAYLNSASVALMV